MNLVKQSCKIILKVLFYLDDSNWNYENLKLGLVEDQSYNDLNLDIGQFVKKNANEHSLNASFLNESTQSYHKLSQSSNIKSQSLFASDKLTDGNVGLIKKSLKNNYWEFSN